MSTTLTNEWKELARQSVNKPLPSGVDPLQYGKAVNLAIKTGHKGAVAIVNKVLELQNNQGRVPTHPAHSDSPNGQEAEQALATEGERQPVQKRVEASQPGIETGGDETVSNRLTDASTGQSEPSTDSMPSLEEHEEIPTQPEKTLRESLKEQLEELKKELKDEKDIIGLRKRVRMVETDKQKLKELDAEIAKREAKNQRD
jgi:hypothetical protein